MDQKELKYEKGILHVRYLLVIAIILVVIGVSLAFGGDSEALGQISMASTVSSIILSSIAIFMSISGENKLNYTHDKLVETSDRMSNITVNIEDANRLLEDTITEKFTKIDDIFERLEQIGRSVGNVEKEMFSRTFNSQEDDAVDISDDVLWKIYEKITCTSDNLTNITERLMEYIVITCSKDRSLDYDKFSKYLRSFENEDDFSYGMSWGVLGVFIALNITKDQNIEYFKKRMIISDEKRNEIKKFLHTN